MGGLGPKGVDVYVANEKHGLILSSGTKGLVYDVRKNLLNRFRDIVAESLELHMRFPYAVCGHVFFVDAAARDVASRLHGTVLNRIATLLQGIEGRRSPADPPETYEQLSLAPLILAEGRIEMQPPDLPDTLHLHTYCDRMLVAFGQRNPFYEP